MHCRRKAEELQTAREAMRRARGEAEDRCAEERAAWEAARREEREGAREETVRVRESQRAGLAAAKEKRDLCRAEPDAARGRVAALWQGRAELTSRPAAAEAAANAREGEGETLRTEVARQRATLAEGECQVAEREATLRTAKEGLESHVTELQRSKAELAARLASAEAAANAREGEGKTLRTEDARQRAALAEGECRVAEREATLLAAKERLEGRVAELQRSGEELAARLVSAEAAAAASAGESETLRAEALAHRATSDKNGGRVVKLEATLRATMEGLCRVAGREATLRAAKEGLEGRLAELQRSGEKLAARLVSAEAAAAASAGESETLRAEAAAHRATSDKKEGRVAELEATLRATKEGLEGRLAELQRRWEELAARLMSPEAADAGSAVKSEILCAAAAAHRSTCGKKEDRVAEVEAYIEGDDLNQEIGLELRLPQRASLWTVQPTDCVALVHAALDLGSLRPLLLEAKLTVPATSLSAMGAVSYREARAPISCVLFQRDTCSAGIIIYDLTRLATRATAQRRGHATACVDALVVLLRRKFSNDRIILRAGVPRHGIKAAAFYERMGFQRGVPRGLSSGALVGTQMDCDVHHLVVPGLAVAVAAARRRRRARPAQVPQGLGDGTTQRKGGAPPRTGLKKGARTS